MEILKAATDWAHDEVFSAIFFILFGIIFGLAAIAFWKLGRTDLARAFIVPMLVSGILLISIGLGLFFTNQTRAQKFTASYHADSEAFVRSELSRTEASMREYNIAIYRVIPAIIILATLLIVFVDRPLWRAIGITTIACMAIVVLIDSNANARLEAYHKQLVVAQSE